MRLINYTYDHSLEEIEIISDRRFPDSNLLAGGYETLKDALEQAKFIRENIKNKVRKDSFDSLDLSRIDVKNEKKSVESKFIFQIEEQLKNSNLVTSLEPF